MYVHIESKDSMPCCVIYAGQAWQSVFKLRKQNWNILSVVSKLCSMQYTSLLNIARLVKRSSSSAWRGRKNRIHHVDSSIFDPGMFVF